MADALVVGAGPVGLTLAGELARHGVRCRIIDRLSHPLPYCRAIGVAPRTLEVWEDMGVAREMIDAGLWLEGSRSVINGGPARDAREEFPDLPYGRLGLPQYETERILARHLEGFGVKVEHGVALTALAQEQDSVTTQLGRTGGDTENATFQYVVGCDGAHSAVRRALGIAFEGDAYPMRFMLGDTHIAWDLPRGMMFRALRLVDGGAPDMFIAIPLPEPGRYRVSMVAPAELAVAGGTDHGIQSEARGPTLDEIQAVANRLVPGQPVVSDLRWSSVFRISMRLAERYRQGRVFIAGDAAHIHPPTGGQGMNTGIQDAYNLAWKLALVLKASAPKVLLDSYEAERRPVGVEVVARTRAATESYGRESGGKPDRLADTQIRVSYRGTDWVRDDAKDLDAAVPEAGDRAPDAGGLTRHGMFSSLISWAWTCGRAWQTWRLGRSRRARSSVLASESWLSRLRAAFRINQTSPYCMIDRARSRMPTVCKERVFWCGPTDTSAGAGRRGATLDCFLIWAGSFDHSVRWKIELRLERRD
jgi:2-polyprenyl-6-methoxyphenol hydroxylase-like FAD-dependent oxidoreductase